MTMNSSEEQERRHRFAMDYINSPEAQRFYKWRRRHEANVFNAHFYDREPITEDQVRLRVEKASEFFDLPVPLMVEGCDALAEITFTSEKELGSEIRYDVARLEKAGINNPDAFDVMLTHELSHQFLADKTFSFCRNENWSVELACDFIAGVRCLSAMLASGKYKYAVGTMKVSETHPPGEFRMKAVKSGYEFAQWLSKRNVRASAQWALSGVTQFLLSNSKELNRAFLEFVESPPQPPKERDIMSLPDSNLIKQYILKHGSKI